MTSTAVRAAGGVAAAGAACVAYGVVVERRWYRLRHLALPGTLTRPTPRPLRVLHVADLHLLPGQADRLAFLRRCAAEDVDLVVAAGDLIGTAGMEDATVAALAPLTADGTPGVAVLGSNDLFAPRPKTPAVYFLDRGRRHFGTEHDVVRFTAGLGDAGYTVLRGATTSVDTPLGTVGVGGLDDPHVPAHVLPPAADVTPDVADPVLRLGLVHAPYVRALDLLASTGAGLLLAGHTHGGQVRLPGVGALTANCDIPLRQARGPSRWRGRWLHVSPGLGHSPYAPYRFGCRPEATVLHLTA
ncbi:MAG: metallophosphoesterase [Actinomycetes bacterium]